LGFIFKDKTHRQGEEETGRRKKGTKILGTI
jgi:hypothetical protein